MSCLLSGLLQCFCRNLGQIQKGSFIFDHSEVKVPSTLTLSTSLIQFTLEILYTRASWVHHGHLKLGQRKGTRLASPIAFHQESHRLKFRGHGGTIGLTQKLQPVGRLIRPYSAMKGTVSNAIGPDIYVYI